MECRIRFADMLCGFQHESVYRHDEVRDMNEGRNCPAHFSKTPYFIKFASECVAL